MSVRAASVSFISVRYANVSELVLIFPIASAATRAALAPPLGRARQAAVAGGDWRAWLADRLDAPALAACPPAQLAAGQSGARSGDAWFATPVTLVAAMDHVRLAPEGWVALAVGEAAELAAGFAREFANSGQALAPAGAEGFLLTGLAARAARTHDPARLLGASIGPWMASGEGAAALRRLGAELEMWLHEHPVNRARERRNAPPVSALWLWGGGEGAQSSPGPPGSRSAWARGYGEDSWLRGLWRAAGRELEGAAESLAQVAVVPQADTIVVARRGVGNDVMARWLEPAIALLAARRVEAVRVVIDDRQFRLSRFDLVKPWRRTVSWGAPA
jgi:hypothetical protein